MAETLTTIRAAVRQLIPNVTIQVLADPAVDNAIQRAMGTLNSDKPRLYTERATATGDKVIALADLTTNWQEGFSKVKRVFYPYPALSTGTLPTELEIQVDWIPIDEDDVAYLRFTTIPKADDPVGVVYTLPYALTGVEGAEATTIPSGLVNAVVFCATAYTCYVMADKMAGTTDQMIRGDAMNFGSKEGSYRRMGDKWMGEYNSLVGKGTTVPAAGARRNIAREPQFGGGFMTHRRSGVR
jgi:hypothetical protein